jgi:hypothetical protein
MTAISRLIPEAVDAAEHRFLARAASKRSSRHLGNADGFRLAEPKPEAILDWRSALGIRNPVG